MKLFENEFISEKGNFNFISNVWNSVTVERFCLGTGRLGVVTLE